MYANQVGAGNAAVGQYAVPPVEPEVQKWLSAAELELSRLAESGGYLVERLAPVLSVDRAVAVKGQQPTPVPAPLSQVADRLRSLTERMSTMSEALNAARNALEI